MPILLFRIFLVSLALAASTAHGLEANWIKLDTGMEFAEFEASADTTGDKVKISVLRVNPRDFELKLFTTSDLGGESMTAKEWAKKFKLLAVTNAGMYQEDGKTSVGFMKSKGRILNSRIAKAYKTMLALEPKNKYDRDFEIIDMECEKDNTTINRYKTVIQNIRMISCNQENVWTPQTNSWSVAALGMDKSGNILFLMSVTPLSVHDFIKIILQLPLKIHVAMYLEGGKQASLYINAGGREIQRAGKSGININTSDAFWPIPNVLGLVKKK
ncbi:phosphodiester glycosidase family protein [Candidatus Magnetomonas plexicatena]|uniref:phosphodiester glycosidase family protein n=1 Tax=Candidatus Magnetomonas plexicatena TaxID=2552947 RepID=UPI001C763B5F|nr:phosphodiester glycosidase family protein [Nitrospirales bacterium LBB_01]